MLDGLRKHLGAEIFVAATGLSALVHSTWSLGIMFAGPQPEQNAVEQLGDFVLRYFAWAIPGFLIAFSLDIGQIMTSHEIRKSIMHGRQPYAKYIAFIVFAVATYYLQWLYLSHHMPMLALGEGVSEAHRQFAMQLRDAAVWIIPAFLPVSTLLYTFSHVPEQEAAEPESITVMGEPEERSEYASRSIPITYLDSPQIAFDGLDHILSPGFSKPHSSPTGVYTNESKNAVVPCPDGTFEYTCPYCGMHKGGYPSERAALNGCSSHVGRWCKNRPEGVQSNDGK